MLHQWSLLYQPSGPCEFSTESSEFQDMRQGHGDHPSRTQPLQEAGDLQEAGGRLMGCDVIVEARSHGRQSVSMTAKHCASKEPYL